MRLSDSELEYALTSPIVSFAHMNLGGVELLALFSKLKQNGALKSLDLSNTTENSTLVDCCVALIGSNPNVSNLILNNCHLAFYDIRHLLKAISDSGQNIARLSFLKNALDGTAMRDLQIFKSHHPSISMEFSSTMTREPEDRVAVYHAAFDDLRVYPSFRQDNDDNSQPSTSCSTKPY